MLNDRGFPSNINFKFLNELDLTGCSLFKRFPEISTNIKVLKLSGNAIKEVPSSIMSWSRPSKLHMSYFEDLKELSDALEIIIKLHLSDTEIQEVAPWIKNLSRVRQLVLKGCRKLVSLPQLPDSLLKIDAGNCESLERLDCSFANPKIRLNFANCLKLNQEARNMIIQTSASAHAILPGVEVPLYFTHIFDRDSGKVKLNRRLLPTSLIFKVCILLVTVADNAGDRKAMRVSSYVEKPNALIVKNRPSSQSLTLLLIEHLYTFEIEVEVKASKLEFAFKVDSDKWKIAKCGVKLLEGPSVDEHGESSMGDQTKLTGSVNNEIKTKLELKLKEKHVEEIQ